MSAKNITLKNVPMYKRTFMYPEEIILVLRKLKEDGYEKNWMNIYFAYETGARYNEIRHVKVEDLFFQIPMVNFKITKGRGKAKKGEKKISKARQVKISDTLAKSLKKYISKYKLKSNDYLFTMSNSTLSRAIKRILNELNHPMPDMFSMHNIRKTHITFRIALGDKMEIISLECGHDESTEKKYYASPDLFTPEQKFLMIESLGRKLSF